MIEPPTDPEHRPTRSVLQEGVHLVILLGLIAACAYTVCERSEVRFMPTPGFTNVVPLPPEAAGVPCGPPGPDGRPVIVEMLYGEEKRGWVEAAAAVYSKFCPSIQIQLTAMSDIAAAETILSGEVSPTVWSPTDEIIVASLDDRWRRLHAAPLFAEDSPVSLLRSPLVLLMWEDRLRVFNAIRERIEDSGGPWSQLVCAGISLNAPVDTVALADRVPGMWGTWYDEVVGAPQRAFARASADARKKANPKRRAEPSPPPPAEVEEPKIEYTAPFPSALEIAGWGRVKVGHSSPTHTAAGLQAIYLMAYDLLVSPTAQRAGEAGEPVLDDFAEGPVRSLQALAPVFVAALTDHEEALRRWIARCEGGLEGDPRTTALLTETMFHVGNERYDAVATYEHLVFPILERLEGNADVMHNVTVVYPSVTFVNKHPALLMAGGDEQRHAAARAWLEFLLSEEMQRLAIEFGFRPANADVKIREHHVDANPFLRFRRYGIQFAATITEPPRLAGERVNQLLELWREATGRN